MSLKPSLMQAVPAMTVQVARAAFPKGSPYLTLRDELGPIFMDEDFLDLYPEDLRGEIDRWNERIYPTLNNGVYRAGFAGSQQAYEEAARGVFETLDAMEAQLEQTRYLTGEWLTEADWRAFTTLVRFDVGYHGAFKCNLRRIEDYPALRGYLRELYQWPGIATTVKLEDIKRNYYALTDKHHLHPIGPELDLTTPHDRARLPGKGIWERPA